MQTQIKINNKQTVAVFSGEISNRHFEKNGNDVNQLTPKCRPI
jgi:hypothetical protein